MKRTIFLFFLFSGITLTAQVDSLRRLLESASGNEKFNLLTMLIVQDSGSAYLDYYRQAVQMSNASADSQMKMDVLLAVGDHHAFWGNPDTALTYYQKALAIAREKKSAAMQIKCLDKTGTILSDQEQYEKAKASFDEALRIARQSGNKKGIASSLESIGFLCLNQHNYNEALNYFKEQEKNETGDSSALASCYNNIGLASFQKGDFVTSIRYYRNAYLIKSKLGESWAAATTQLNLGISYKEQGVYDLAFANMLQAAVAFEKAGPSIELASCYSSIGNAFLELDSTEDALTYHFKALHIRKELDYSAGVAQSLTNLGSVYKVQGKYDLALKFLFQSLEIKKQLGDKMKQASSMSLIGEVYFLQKNYTEAEYYFQQSLALQRETEDPKGIATSLNNFGKLYLDWGKYEQAIICLDESRVIARNIGAKNVLLKNYETTISVLRRKGKTEEALYFYDDYLALKDTVLNEQKNKAITELQIKYETEKKEQEISLLNAKEKASAAIVDRQHFQIYALYAGAALLLLIALLLFNAYRLRRKAHQQSQIIIAQKQTMMSELHHRIKNNLQVLSSILELQQDRTNDPATQELLKAVENRLNAMLLIHKDLYGDKIDGKVNMGKYIRTLTEHLFSAYGFAVGSIRLNFSADELLVDADTALSLGFICNEIISNTMKHAFQHTPNPELSVQITNEQEQCRLLIADNGCGFSAVPDIEKTHSFGLRLIRLFATDIHAELNFESDENGTRFILFFPIPKTIV